MVSEWFWIDGCDSRVTLQSNLAANFWLIELGLASGNISRLAGETLSWIGQFPR